MSEAHAAEPGDFVFITGNAKAMTIVAKMAEAHQMLRGILGERFPKAIAVWIANIRRVMAVERCGSVEAMHKIIKICSRESGDFGFETLALLAACYEMQGGPPQPPKRGRK